MVVVPATRMKDLELQKFKKHDESSWHRRAPYHVLLDELEKSICMICTEPRAGVDTGAYSSTSARDAIEAMRERLGKED
jgi:hypothetical protein